uniref:Endoplasmic reticulum oxidoreductin-1 n=1 Tax=Hirondellea gigas TaxID=1518452 RepID=A0A6A7GCP2_9CRUS
MPIRALVLFFSVVRVCAEIPECCCTKETVETTNAAFTDILDRLRATTFFRIFKVSLNENCQFWSNPKTCSQPTCAVCACEENEVPSPWLSEQQGRLVTKAPGLFDFVNRTLESEFLEWEQDDDDWIVQSPNSKMSYINLAINPHTDTGYSGEGPRRIWEAIHGQNCFDASDDQYQELCLEGKVFFRLISGLRSCVTAHVSGNYISANQQIKPNLQLFQKSLGDHPDRLDSLYFVFVFLVRAVHKARQALLDFDYNTGNPEEDLYVSRLIEELMEQPMIRSCPASEWFDESALFEGNPLHPQIAQYKAHFRNISLILDCVECEKCQLYGKLQVLGIGTALKIMFAKQSPMPPDAFQRNEIIALVMTLAQFSDGLHIIQSFQQSERSFRVSGALSIFSLCLFGVFCFRRCRTSSSIPHSKRQ